MIIALDAMGGDRAPAEPVSGALLAKREFGIDVALVGSPSAIREELSKHGETPSGIDIVEAAEVIEMDDPPVQAVRQKKQASINVAMGQIKSGSAAAVVSAGNTGAVMASALLNLGRVKEVERPAIGAMAPFTEMLVKKDNQATAYVCVNYACKLPTTDPKTFAAQLDERPEPAATEKK